MSNNYQDLVEQLEAQVTQLSRTLDQTNVQLQQTTAERDRANLLYDVNTALNTANLDIEAVTTIVINLAKHIGASVSEVYLLIDADHFHFNSSLAARKQLSFNEQETLVLKAVSDGPIPDALDDNKILIIPDIQQDFSHALDYLDSSIQSLMCVPFVVDPDWPGAVIFGHHQPYHFTEHHASLLQAIIPQAAAALEKATHVREIKASLHETHLMLDISRQLGAADDLDDIYDALVHSIIHTGADHCVLYMCEEIGKDNLPVFAHIVFSSDRNMRLNLPEDKQPRLKIADYPLLHSLITNRETLLIENISTTRRLTEQERAIFIEFQTESAVINPLVTRNSVIGCLSIEYQSFHTFTERELDLYRALCNQTTIAIESTLQKKRTQEALAETQTLYRAGRVLAGAADLQEILEKSLVEFVYSLGLDQGGVTLISPDRQTGKLMAYLESGELQNIEKLKFPVDETLPYQKTLLAGRPFVSTDVTDDNQFDQFVTFNKDLSIKSILQAPMIIRGETIGWIGADAVRGHRDFSQREIDLARAMADQIAISIQNRRLLRQTELRADRLKAVAMVGEAVTGLTELVDVLNQTVNLIRDRFGFYHVSIFLLDDAREWAVVRASTGEIGKIMVERPHKLGVGSNSIVGYCTQHAEPRIALDVGEDAIHFENPLLPNTRSEMALPLVLRGVVIGALDVQSVEPNAFSDEDVETLQIMTNQVTAAISNTRLFEQIQHRLSEQQQIYKIGTQLGSTLDLYEATNILTTKTAQMLNVAECVVSLVENGRTIYIISDYVQDESQFNSDQGERFDISEFASWKKILTTQQAQSWYIDAPDDGSWEFTYLKAHGGTAMILVPILLRNQVIGMLEAYDHTPKRRFKQTEITLLESIALQAANAIQNARLFEQRDQLIEETRRTLDRTQTLYRISDDLATSTNIGSTFEAVLNEYLKLLELSQGTIMLFDKATNSSTARARLMNNQVVAPSLSIPIEEDKIFQYLNKHPKPLIINDAQNHELVSETLKKRGHDNVNSMLFIPFTSREQLMGSLVIDVTQEDYAFDPSDIDIGEAIADQVTIFLENRHLLNEAQYRFDRLQTAAKVSQAASQILDIDELINTSVNLIRDQFEFYYVGLFLVDEAGEWAVLQAGTGEAGKIQLAKKHKLKIGGESMIGWSIANRQARIALDVGEEAVRFQNPDLPDTHSEMALPMISHDDAIGALTVQSIERGAFSDEDITLLQTMADQLGSALANASLFERVEQAREAAENHLRETQTLQQLSQALAGTLKIEDVANAFFQSCNQLLNFDYVVLSLIDDMHQEIRSVAGHNVTEEYIDRSIYKLGKDNILADVIRNQQIETIVGWDERLDPVIFEAAHQSDWGPRVFVPITLRKRPIGVVEAGFREQQNDTIPEYQLELLQTFIDQIALALESAQRYEAAQKAARREKIIREVTEKIQNAITVEDILKTTVSELGKIVGTTQAGINLGSETTTSALQSNRKAKSGERIRQGGNKTGSPASRHKGEEI
ncbi:MAG: GAF domain-containing protein [Anaerolineae bacterium]|nr:GAF domain-containing protein [Anaerolineae bacterium]